MEELRRPEFMSFLHRCMENSTPKMPAQIIGLHFCEQKLREAIPKVSLFADVGLADLISNILGQISDGDVRWAFFSLCCRNKSSLEKLQKISNPETDVMVYGKSYPLKFALAAFIAASVYSEKPLLICNRLQFSQTRRSMTNVRQILARSLRHYIKNVIAE